MRQRRPAHLPILPRNPFAQKRPTQKVVLENPHPRLRLRLSMRPLPKLLPLSTLSKLPRILRRNPILNPLVRQLLPRRLAIKSPPRHHTHRQSPLAHPDQPLPHQERIALHLSVRKSQSIINPHTASASNNWRPNSTSAPAFPRTITLACGS